MKYEDAFWDTKQTIVTIEELQKIKKYNWNEYEEKYKNHIFCDECHIAPLSMVEGKFLKAFPKSEHAIWCSKVAPEVSQKKLEEILSEPEKVQNINEKLKNALSAIFENKRVDSNNNPFTIKQKNNNNKNITKNNYKIYRIPKKSINRPFSEEDLNIYKIFYGKAFLVWKEYPERYLLNLISNKNSKSICSIWISRNVFNHLPSNFKKVYSKQLRKISFFAKITKNKDYYNVNIKHSDLLIIL